MEGVWAYSPRTLTPHAFPFTNPASPVDLTNVSVTAAVDPSSVWTHPTRTLTDPDSYKADVSALALEATLGGHDADIKGLIGALNDLSATEVWAYATRTLTSHIFPFTNPASPVQLDNLRVALYSDPLNIIRDAILSDATKFAGADVPAIKAQTDKIPRVVSRMDFWSDNDDEIALTTVSSSHNLPNVVVAGLPSGITIIRVVALLKIAIIKDTSGSDNAVNSVTMALKVDATGGYPSTVTAIDIPNDSWAVDVSEATERGGDAMIGDNDIKAEVTGNGTFYGRFESAACDGNNLKLKDIAWGLRVYFTA